MKDARPVAVFRYSDTEGPGHFATFLEANRLPWTLVKLDRGDPVPASSEPFAGLGFMGGPMSANDELAWTQPVLALMREARSRGVPMIGHCLGGQLMSKGLGGEVTRARVKEIGWLPVRADPNTAAREWFGADGYAFDPFEWHEDTVAIPPGATRILTGANCPNQAYVLDDRHLGMQCHVEITAEMIVTWCRIGITDIDENVGRSPAVQDAATIKALIPKNLPGSSATAERLYTRWITNLRR